MVNCCISNPGTNIGKPVFMNDPDILFMLMFKSLLYSITIQYFNRGDNWTKTNAGVGGDENSDLFVEMVGYSGVTNRDDDKPRKSFLVNKTSNLV